MVLDPMFLIFIRQALTKHVDKCLKRKQDNIIFCVKIYWSKAEAYSEPSQISKMEFFVKIGNICQQLNDFRKKLRLRCLTVFWMHLCKF